jgi:hypothetical protein
MASLPLKTQYLLTSHGEFESAANNDRSTGNDQANNKKSTTSRLNREIQIYQSLPFVLGSIDAPGISDLCKQNLSLIETHLSSSDIYAQLRMMCADTKANNNCDLNIVHLNQLITSNAKNAAANAAASMHLSLASNKYFRRLLGQAILSELLGVKLVNTSKHLVNYLPGFNLFQVHIL